MGLSGGRNCEHKCWLELCLSCYECVKICKDRRMFVSHGLRLEEYSECQAGRKTNSSKRG